MSQAGIVDIEGSHPQIPTSFVTNMGTAIPIGNVLEVLGTTVAAHSIPLETTGSGNTVTIVAQYASGAASSVGTNAGFASFSSTQFSVDANGYVTLNGAVVAETITGNTGGPLSPVAGNWNIFGSSVAAGTTPVHTAGSGNTLTVDVQISQAIAATDATKIGLAAFNSTYFTVDANGFVSFNGGLFGETITGNTGGALSPTAGNWNILGTSTAAGTTPVQTAGSGSTLTIQVQKSQAIASTDATKVGLATFNSTFFTVDGNGFVSINGAAIAETITGNVGGALSPTAGNWNILGTSTAAGTTPVQTSGSGSTLTVQVQKSQAIAATDATKVGLANFNSADFSVDANGFVSAASTGYIRTITGTTGGAESPAAGGNFNLLGATALAGTTPVVVAGSANTETIKVQISQAIASTDATKVGLAAFDSSAFAVDANGFVTLSGTGDLRTLSDDVGTTITPSGGNIQLVGHVVEQGATKFSTVVAGTNLAKINPMSASRWIVDPLGFNGTHTTIASAITSATSGDTIFLLPGSYTENITLKAGVNLTAYSCDALTPNVTIVGKATFTTAGTVSISGIQLQTNSDFFLAITGNAASNVYLKDCYLNVLNNTGITFTSSSGSSGITIDSCIGNIGTTGITYIVSTASGNVSVYDSVLNNAGASVTASSTSTGVFTFFNCTFGVALSTSTGGVVNAYNSILSSGNATALTTAGTGGGFISNCYVSGGSASALSAGSGTTIQAFSSTISSSNTNAITGAGTINYGGLIFSSTSSTINTTSKTPVALTVFQGGTGLTSTTSQQILYSSSANTIAGLATGNSLLAATNSSGTLAMRALSVVRQVFTSTGTYTPTAGMVYCDIEVLGGGGGGGSVPAVTNVQVAGAGGGGAGGYARGTFSAATIGGSKSVTIGAAGTAGTAGGSGGTGGTTSVGSTLLSATGGTGGGAGTAATGAYLAGGGSGGSGSSGDFQTTGEGGQYSLCLFNAAFPIAFGGTGGSTFFGGGAIAPTSINGSSVAGNAATSYGGGGSGAANTLTNTAHDGGAGAKGVVIVTEYVIA